MYFDIDDDYSQDDNEIIPDDIVMQQKRRNMQKERDVHKRMADYLDRKFMRENCGDDE